jgi:hypothetical protein
VETIERLRIYKKEQQLSVREPELAKEKLKDIVGNLVEFPIKFLGLENLSPAITTKEGLVPNIVFT